MNGNTHSVRADLVALPRREHVPLIRAQRVLDEIAEHERLLRVLRAELMDEIVPELPATLVAAIRGHSFPEAGDPPLMDVES